MVRTIENLAYVSSVGLLISQCFHLADEVALAFMHDFIIMLIAIGYYFEGYRIG